MFQPHILSENFAATGHLRREDLAAAAARGYKTIINLLPEAECDTGFGLAEIRRQALAQGMAFVHIPAAKHDLFTDGVVGRMQFELGAARGPVLASCASGQRAAIVWAAAAARSKPVDDILAALAKAGFNLAFLRDDLEAQADRARWMPGASPSPRAAA